jgi:hypothetical protein
VKYEFLAFRISDQHPNPFGKTVTGLAENPPTNGLGGQERYKVPLGDPQIIGNLSYGTISNPAD